MFPRLRFTFLIYNFHAYFVFRQRSIIKRGLFLKIPFVRAFKDSEVQNTVFSSEANTAFCISFGSNDDFSLNCAFAFSQLSII
jgi:hypothetical protein